MFELMCAGGSLEKRFEGLGMSSAYSAVLGKSVESGSIGREKIDGATGSMDCMTWL